MRFAAMVVAAVAVFELGCPTAPAIVGGMPDAGALAWPVGARLSVIATTDTTATLQWPAAMGPAHSFTVSIEGRAAQTVLQPTFVVMGLSASHLRATVVATSTDGQATPPLRAEVAGARRLEVPPGDVSTDFCGANDFLNTADIPCESLAVVVGHVKTQDGTGIPGLTASVLGHPEFGSTTTQADGQFSLAMPAGTWTVDVRAAAFVPMQRWVTARPRDFTAIKDIVALRRDTKATTFTVSQGGFHQSTPVTDARGTRSTSVFVPTGTHASLHFADGGTLAAPTLTLRATESTVGPTGHESMPASLPPSTAYTYEVDISADEALQAGAEGITFDTTVAFYTDNVLHYRVGAYIPQGSYDTATGAWEAGRDAVAVQVVSGGLDATGDGVADTEVGLLEGEAEAVASHFAIGTQLVRATTTHFSGKDLNPCWICLGSCEPAGERAAKDSSCANTKTGSLVRVENQTLSEFTDVAGTPYTLAWHSNRNGVRKSQVRMRLETLDDGGVPVGGAGTYFSLEVAGQLIEEERGFFDGGVTAVLTWDGKDAFGRSVGGSMPATATSGFGFGLARVDLVGTMVPATTSSWAQWPPAGAVQLGDSGEVAFVLRRTAEVLGDWTPKENLGGLTLTALHGYSMASQTLYRGDGNDEPASQAGALVKYLAGGDGRANDGTFGDVAISSNTVIAASNAGTYFTDNGGYGIWLLDAATHRARQVSGGDSGFAGDGQDASLGRFHGITSLHTDSAGNLYVVDAGNFRVRRIDAKTNILTTVVGAGVQGYSPDGTPAALARLDALSDMVPSRDGTLLVLTGAPPEVGGQVLRRVTATGALQTVAGGATDTTTFEPQSPTELRFGDFAMLLAEGPEGDIYLGGYQDGAGRGYVIRRIHPDGHTSLVVGRGESLNPREPVARNTGVGGLSGLAVSPDGVVYFLEGNTSYVRDNGLRAVLPTGEFVNVTDITGDTTGLRLADGLAGGLKLAYPRQLTLRPDGALVFLNVAATPALHVVSSPGASLSRTVPSRDGSEVYTFDAQGRHLRTVDAVTGRMVHSFQWGAHGLVSVTDGDGNVTSVQRDGSGRALALVAPDGQRTTLGYDEAGRVVSVTDSESRLVEAAYFPNGLMREWRDENGNATAFTWDDAGKLLTHTNARNAVEAYLPVGGGAVDYSSGEGRVTRYARDLSGTLQLTQTPDGVISSLGMWPGVRAYTAGDGTVYSTTFQTSARFSRGVDVPRRVLVRTPSGLTGTSEMTETSVVAADSVSLASQVSTTNVNGKTWRRVWDAASRSWTSTTPVGRVGVARLDSQLRVSEVALPGQLPVVYGYDSRGRLSTVTQGSRRQTFGYGSNGYVATVANALGEVTALSSDSTGRVGRVVRPDGMEELVGYDAAGNVTSVTPAQTQAHGLAYSETHRQTRYMPPALPGVQPEGRSYDKDELLTSSRWGDGSESAVVRDVPTGRATSLVSPWWKTDVGYDAVTGKAVSVARAGQAVRWGYDGFLTTSEATSGLVAAKVGRDFDSNFRLQTQWLNDAGVAYRYDDDGLLTGAGAEVLTRVPSTGQLQSVTLGAVTTGFTYNGYGEVSAIAATWPGGAYSESLTFDNAGRLVGVDEGVTRFVYGYDAVGRLVSSSKDGAQHGSWGYSGNGNRVVNGTESATYDAQDRLVTAGAAVFVFDALGGRQTKTVGGQVTKYVHDGLGALQAVTLPDGTFISYDYDGLQRRIAKRRNGVVEKRWVYDGQYRVIAEVDASGAVTSRFVYGSLGHSPDYLQRGRATYAYIHNHLGSVKYVVDVSSGAVAQRLDYDEWGQVVADSSPGFQPFGFAGGVYDVDTALTHFGYRDYDARYGVWTSKDPIRLEGGSNCYAYATNDPIGSLDVDGKNTIRAAIRVAGAGIKVGRRLSERAAIQAYRSGRDIVTNTVANARRLAAKAGRGEGGKCSKVEKHKGGSNHVHALDGAGDHLDGAGHIFIDSELAVLIGGLVDAIVDPNGNGIPNDEEDLWEWLSPLPIDMPIRSHSVDPHELL